METKTTSEKENRKENNQKEMSPSRSQPNTRTKIKPFIRVGKKGEKNTVKS